MKNKKMISTLVFVLLLSPCLLNSVSKEYVAEKTANFFTTAFMAGTLFKAQTKDYSDGSTYNDTTSKIALGTGAGLLARIASRKLLKTGHGTKSSNITSLSKDALSLMFSTGLNHWRRTTNYTLLDTEQNIVQDSLKIATATTVFELLMDLIGYCYSSH